MYQIGQLSVKLYLQMFSDHWPLILPATERFFNLFGFHGARLSNVQSIRGPKETKRSLLITLLSPVLFYAPEVHLTALEKLWVDQVVRFRLWDTFRNEVERDWEGFILTVCLTFISLILRWI